MIPGARHCLILLALFLAWAPGPVPAQVNDSLMKIASPGDIPALRDSLVRFIWGGEGWPAGRLPVVTRNVPLTDFYSLAYLKRCDELRVFMETSTDTPQQGLAYHLIPREPKGRLMIFNPGHTCSFIAQKYHPSLQNAVDALLRNGFSVLALYMPGRTPEQCTPHNLMFTNHLAKTGSEMRFFFEPIAADLNYLRTCSARDSFPEYGEYGIMGLSGGGWTASLYAALDTSIRTSVSVAGSLPLYAFCYALPTEIEQTLPEFYSMAGYLDLYAMAAFGAGRQQVQILNRYDDCCYGEAQYDCGGSWDAMLNGYASHVRGTLANLGAGDFSLHIDETTVRHEISTFAMQNIILPGLIAAEKTQAFSALHNGLTLWPNPFHPQVRISLTGSLAKDALVRVYDLSGRLVEDISGKALWDASGRAPGVYMIAVEKEGRKIRKKVIFSK